VSALWTAAAAATATGGRATTDWVAKGVSIDTRTLQPGDLFVALKDVRDGHEFVAQALEKGAAAALVSRVPEGVTDGAPLLIVDDVLDGLTALGAAGRARTGAQVIGVTGSVGKTSSKEMLREALTSLGRVHAAEASYNNQWGVPLTLARMPADTDVAIVEIGMNHPGEIAPLSRLTRPHVALITTVVGAHMEAFDDLDGIAHEKASIFEGLEPGGIAIIPGDLGVSGILRAAAGPGAVTFGPDHANDWHLISVRLGAASVTGQAGTPLGPLLFKIASPGRHFAENALGVLAVADAVGADMAIAIADLGRWQPPAGRGTREELVLDDFAPGMSLILIDDAFNANPASLDAAFEVLVAQSPTDGVGRVGRGRRIAILGDMLELGADEVAQHARVATSDHLANVDTVHCAGPLMAALWHALPDEQRGVQLGDALALAQQAHRLVDAGDIVLVKGSKGSKISLVVDAIRKLGHARDHQNGNE
jgi:UDP-N-acetylmuramoyl-tripeptide--D-alanyl-D-alanine ligase